MGLVTGCFSLVGIQEVISYEYIYKLTQYNVVPDTPVSSNAEGSVPEGWSSQLLGVSASLPYLWESRRQKKDSYVTRDLSSSSFTSNYWIGTNGVASYSNGYSYSEVFDLPSGQTIEVLTAGTGFSVISKYSNRSYTPIVKASGSVSEQKMYTYTADTDCQIVVSVYHLSSYSVKITSGTWSAWSTPTLKSSWGKQGAKMRMRTWTADTEYLSGADGEDFYDVVIYLEKLYLCTKTHTSKSGTNDPVTSINGYLGFWESAQEWTFVATELLLTKKIKANQIDADGLVAKNVDIEGNIVAESGLFKGNINIGNGSNIINKDGSGQIAKGNILWDSNGNIEFGEEVTFGGFISHIQMLFIPVRQSSGNYFYYISESTPVTNKILLSSTNNNDMVILPRGEKWSGALLYIYNISSSNSLKVNTGDTIPARGVGVFSGFPITPGTPETTTWAKLAISGTAATLGFNYED